MLSRLRPEEGWSTLGLLSLLLLIMAWSLEAAEWAQGLAVLQWVVIGAIVTGLVLAKLKWLPGPIAHWLGTLMGVAWSTYLITTLLPRELGMGDKLLDIKERLLAWVKIAQGQGISTDNLIFILQMSILIWLVSYVSTWLLFRSHRPWWAIIPSGIAVLINVYYYFGTAQLSGFLILWLLFALVLIIRSTIYIHERAWQSAGIIYNSDIGFDFLREGAIAAIVILVLAWRVPASAATTQLYTLWGWMEEPFGRAQDTWNRLFFSLNYSPRPGPAYFGNSLRLSGPVSLGESVVMDVVTDDGRYWKGNVYDTYTGRGWLNTDTQATFLGPNDPRLEQVTYQLREAVTQTIRIYQPSGESMIYAVPQPARINVPTRVQFSPMTQTAPSARQRPQLNVSNLAARPRLQEGQTYQVISSMSVADEDILREASTDYGYWITERYLQLPDTLPTRVRELAQVVTDNYDNPYDKAAAIETYLRKIKYNEKIPPPPSGRDGVDYFLFDSREGYCDYYASAFVVMARAVGIPARVAAGYSLGEWDSEIGAYRFRQSDAHSWAEVFFPRYGWVEFEPTAADPRITRPRVETVSGKPTPDPSRLSGRDDIPDFLEDEPVGGFLGDVPPRPGLYLQITRKQMAGLGLLLVMVVAAGSGWWLWQKGLRGLTFVETIFVQMARYAGLIGIRLQAHHTPYEYGAAVGKAVPQGRTEVTQVVDSYVRERFSGRPIDDEEKTQLDSAWQRLQRRLWLQVVRVRAKLGSETGKTGK